MRVRLALTLCVFIVCAGQSGATLSEIETFSAWTGDWMVGLGRTANNATASGTYGQTFTVTGPCTVLESFTFSVRYAYGVPTDLAAYVMAWDQVNKLAEGPVLYQSDMRTITATDTAPVDEVFTTGALALTSGEQYIAFMSTAPFYYPQAGYVAAKCIPARDAYKGGDFFYGSTSSLDQLSTRSWYPCATYPTGTDLAFSMQFSSPSGVPEPASCALLACAVGGIGVMLKRSRRR